MKGFMSTIKTMTLVLAGLLSLSGCDILTLPSYTYTDDYEYGDAYYESPLTRTWTGSTQRYGGSTQDGAVLISAYSHWYNSYLSTFGQSEWFKIPVTPGVKYAVFWNDSYEGNGVYTGDVKVEIYDSQGNLHMSRDSGYVTPMEITPAESFLYLKVNAYFASGGYAFGLMPSGGARSAGTPLQGAPAKTEVSGSY